MGFPLHHIKKNGERAATREPTKHPSCKRAASKPSKPSLVQRAATLKPTMRPLCERAASRRSTTLPSVCSLCEGAATRRPTMLPWLLLQTKNEWPLPLLPVGRVGSQPKLRRYLSLLLCTLISPITHTVATFLMGSRTKVQSSLMDCRVQQIFEVPHSSCWTFAVFSRDRKVRRCPPVAAWRSSKLPRLCASIRGERSSNGCSLGGSTRVREG